MKEAFVTMGLVTLGLLGAEGAAEACGGCFTPPENPTVVTDHRMVFAVSPQQSTLYDQIRYQGSPASFAWVLPYSGEIEVETSSEALFQTLDQYTTTQINAPPRNCPPRPSCDDEADQASGGNFLPPSSPDGVEVIKREVVGPYETVQLKATDPKSLNDWLTQNGYILPEDVKPVVTAYQNEQFNFLALKLVPGKDVQDMRPVRVTTKSNGAQVALPLRMVAAGTGPKVGITLWIVAEGRYEPQNFGSFVIPAGDLVWDWTQNRSNYTELRAQKTTESGGRAWEIESSVELNRINVQSALTGGGLAEYETDATDAGPAKSASVRLTEDVDVLFGGVQQGSRRVTRIRADLDHAALDHDLLVGATPDQAVLSNIRNVTRELNEPTCPVWNGCSQNGTAPRSKAFADSSDGGCATTKPRHASSTWLAVGLGVVVLTLGRVIRRRK